MMRHRPPRPALDARTSLRPMAWTLTGLAVVLGLASLMSGQLDGRALGCILFAAAAVLLFWEDAR